MKKKLIIFDLDGTLIDTVKDLNIAVNHAIKDYGYEARTLEQTRNDIGNGVAMLIARSIPLGMDNPNYQNILKEFRSYYIKHYFDNSFPYPDVKGALIELKNKGYKLAVVSNKFDEGAKKLVNLYFKNIFDIIQGQVPELKPKPYPDLVDKVMKELSIKKEDALYIGDTEVDYQTAINSGIDVILETYGYRNKKQLLERTDCHLIIDSIKELNEKLGE